MLQAYIGRVERHVGDHAPQLAQPQLHPHRHQWQCLHRAGRIGAGRTPRPRHQHKQRVDDLAQVSIGGRGQCLALHLLGQCADGDHIALQPLEQVGEQQVLLEQLAEPNPPGRRVHLLYRGERLVGEEDAEPSADGLLRVGITRRVQHLGEVGTRRQKVVGRGVTQELTCQESVFSDHRFRREGAVEDLARVFA